jgi:hypothetical protein
MAIPFLNNIDLSDNQLLNAKLHVTSTAPTAAAGQIYFDSTADPGGDPPTYDLTAKYYSNSTDNWVSLKEYTFPAVLAANGYITSAITGTVPKPIITFDLNAVDGTPIAADRYLTKSNKWALISEIPGTYAWTISDNATPTAGTAGVASGNTLQIAASSDLTSTLTGQTETTKVLTVGLKVDGGAGIENNYIVNQGSATAAADDTIPFSDYTDNVDPVLDTYVVKKTTFGTIPVEALTLVKNYIDSSVAGGLVYQGGYDANEDLTSPGGYGLQIPPVPNVIEIGWMYTVTVEGLFFGEQLRVGDVLIAEVDGPTSLADWTTVQNNIDFATAGTDTGVGDPAAVIGISRYDEDDFEVSSTGFVQLLSTSFSGTIGNDAATSIGLLNTGAEAPNINHGLGEDSSSFMVQLVDASSGETVYADVTRGASGLVTIDFAVAPAANGIRVLIQKIG